MIVLGINNMHDASAALVVDGVVIAAAEEERFTRVKHQTGFPAHAIRYCLRHAGIGIGEIDRICPSWKPWVLGTRAWLALNSCLSRQDIFRARLHRGAGQMRKEWSELFFMKRLIGKHFGKFNARVEFVDHHLCHAASTFLCSPFERSAILSVDGAGESETAVLSYGEGTSIRKMAAVKLPFSLGQFYASVTAFLGFKVQSDEYKVMGLAAFGEPVHADYLRRNVVRLRPDGLFETAPDFMNYHLARRREFAKCTTDVFGPPRAEGQIVEKRHADIAASAQAIVEESMSHLVRHLLEATGGDTLVMAGGVALNCVANGKLLKEGPAKRIHIHPAAGDAGCAIGAALYAYHKHTKAGRKFVLDHAYLGPEYDAAQCEAALREKGVPYERMEEAALLKRTATALSEGKLVCWFQGRMEWGPRALGARSLLADPRNAAMKEIINEKVKQREPFRPFAPSVLSEHAAECFEYYHHSPFMLFTFPLTAEMARKVPAVAHVDGTARPQAVLRETNPRYHAMIGEFHALTGVPMVLNTSFNIQEPIVCTPRDGIETFLKTRVEHLVIGDFFATTPSQGE